MIAGRSELARTLADVRRLVRACDCAGALDGIEHVLAELDPCWRLITP